jgi:hypothetical protein
MALETWPAGCQEVSKPSPALRPATIAAELLGVNVELDVSKPSPALRPATSFHSVTRLVTSRSLKAFTGPSTCDMNGRGIIQFLGVRSLKAFTGPSTCDDTNYDFELLVAWKGVSKPSPALRPATTRAYIKTTQPVYLSQSLHRPFDLRPYPLQALEVKTGCPGLPGVRLVTACPLRVFSLISAATEPASPIAEGVCSSPGADEGGRKWGIRRISLIWFGLSSMHRGFQIYSRSAPGKPGSSAGSADRTHQGPSGFPVRREYFPTIPATSAAGTAHTARSPLSPTAESAPLAAPGSASRRAARRLPRGSASCSSAPRSVR